jgi:hypothetical protein
MNSKIEKIKKFRLYLLTQLKGLTNQQLNYIPATDNNNIVWNLGHMIAAQQNMCYVKANKGIVVADDFFTQYLSGKKPERIADEKHIEELFKIFVTCIDQLQNDYDKKLFSEYSPSAAILKVYGFEVSNIDDALDYLLYHEGLHAGQILSLKKRLN